MSSTVKYRSSAWSRPRTLPRAYNVLEFMEITVQVPAPLDGQPTDELARRARLLLVIDEIRAGRLTRPSGARALQMALDEFLIEAGRHGLPAIDYDLDDFRRELDALPAEHR